MGKVVITQYKWAGQWGPFKIKTTCNDCNTTTAMLKIMMKEAFKGKQVQFEIKPWLNNWWKIILQGAYHAPIVMVNGRLFWQFSKKEFIFDKGKLNQLVKQTLNR